MKSALDADGNIYVAGSFWETATFGDTTLISQGESDIYVAKLDRDGNFIWTVSRPGRRTSGKGHWRRRGLGRAISTCHGYFGDTVNFGADEFTSNGDSDAYVAKLDGEGQFLWAQAMGGTER